MIIRFAAPSSPERVLSTDEEVVTVGRSSRGHPVDLDLSPDMQVSHVHAQIVWVDDAFWIEDLGSRNGTWVNGAQVRERTRLTEFDRIQIGQTRIRLESETALIPAVAVVPSLETILNTPPENRAASLDVDRGDVVRGDVDGGDGPAAGADVIAQDEVPGAAGEDSEADAPSEPSLDIVPNEPESGLEPGPGEPAIAGLSQPNSEPELEPEGNLASRLSSGEHPSILILPVSPERLDVVLDATRHRLIAFYNLGAALGSAHDLDSMVGTIVKHLIEAIHGAHRGALLLKDGRNLLLKAHLPGGDPGTSHSLAMRAMENREGFIWQDGLGSASSDPSESIILSGTRSAMYAPMVWGGDPLGVVCVDNITDPDAFDEDDLRLLMAMANHAAMFVKNHHLQQELRREAALRSSLLRQFSPRIAERLLNERGRLRLGGERANPVTILVTDVRGFTALSAKMDPDEVVQLLNAMYALFTPIVFKYEGTVDKFVGDSLLAVFGSPEPDDRQCENAVRAALDMQQAMKKLADVWRIRGMPIWETGIGIHTGEVVHGFIGSTERMEYTVIGDAVNRAARFCDGAGPGEVLISKAVYEHVYRLVQVASKTIETKHPDVEPVLEAYVVRSLRESDSNIGQSASAD